MSDSEGNVIATSEAKSEQVNPDLISSLDESPASRSMRANAGTLNALVDDQLDANPNISILEAEIAVVSALHQMYAEKGLLQSMPANKKQPSSSAKKKPDSKAPNKAKNPKRTPGEGKPKPKDQVKSGSQQTASSAKKKGASGKQQPTSTKPSGQQPTKEVKTSTLLSNFPKRIAKASAEQMSLWKRLVNSFSEKYSLSVASGPQDQLDRLRHLGISTKEPVGMHNTHTLGAGVRAALRRRAIVSAVLNKHNHLVELFGNEQTHQFVTDLNTHLKGCGWQGELVCDTVGEHLSSKDHDKRSGDEKNSNATFGFMIDIYDHECVETPENLSQYMVEHFPRMTTLYVIKNVMTGYAGTAPGYVWFAPEPTKRLVQLGDQTPFEHNYWDWIDVKSHCPSAGWYEDRSYALSDTVSMKGLIFTREGSYLPPPVSKTLKTPYQYFGVPQSAILRTWNWFRGSAPMVLLDQRMIDNAMRRFANKNPTEFTYASIKLQVTQLLSDSGWQSLSLLLDYDNAHIAAVITDLVMHKTYHQNQSSYAAINPFVTKFQGVATNAMFTPRTAPRFSPFVARCLKFGIPGVLLLAAFLYRRRRVVASSLVTILTGQVLPLDEIWTVAVVAPLAEEALKKTLPWHVGALALAVVETVRDRNTLPAWALALRACMHIGSSHLPIRYASIMHMSYNIAVLLYHNPMLRSLSNWIDTFGAIQTGVITTGTGMLISGSTLSAILGLLEPPVTSLEAYQDALIQYDDASAFAPGILAIDCPEFTTCPPAIFDDSQIQMPDDRLVYHGQEVFASKVELCDWMHNNFDPNFRTKIFHVLSFNGPAMWAPQTLKNSPYAAACLAYGRIAKPMPYKPRAHVWNLSEMTPRMRNSLCIFECSQGSFSRWQELWKEHVIRTGKWHKYEQFWSSRFDLDSHDHRVVKGTRKIQIMSKSDEVLIGKNQSKLLPRPIDNINPVVAFVTGPLDYMLKHALLEGRNPRSLYSYSFPYNVGLWGPTIDFNWKFFWVPCLGFTQHDLTEVMQQFVVLDRAALLLSHGDDTLLVYIKKGKILMMESDLSSCDRSLTKHSLTYERDIIDLCMQNAGSDSRFFDANRVAFKLNFADRIIDGIRVSLEGDAQRPTGCTRTSLMNTVLTAHPVLIYHLESWSDDWMDALNYRPEMFSHYYKSHGLDAKVKFHYGSVTNFPTGTFLKGVWLHTDCGVLAWTRLPSMAVKMFKTLKPLPILTKRFRKEKVELEEARRRYCVMIASSWCHFDLPYGIREWVDKWADLDADLPTLPHGGRVDSGVTSLYSFSNQRALMSLAEHYQVEPDLFIDWCEKFKSLEPGRGYCHPIWIALGADY